MKLWRQEKRTLALEQKSGSSASKRKPWPLFTSMSFLQDVKNEASNTKSSTDFLVKNQNPKLGNYVEDVNMFTDSLNTPMPSKTCPANKNPVQTIDLTLSNIDDGSMIIDFPEYVYVPAPSPQASPPTKKAKKTNQQKDDDILPYPESDIEKMTNSEIPYQNLTPNTSTTTTAQVHATNSIKNYQSNSISNKSGRNKSNSESVPAKPITSVQISPKGHKIREPIKKTDQIKPNPDKKSDETNPKKHINTKPTDQNHGNAHMEFNEEPDGLDYHATTPYFVELQFETFYNIITATMRNLNPWQQYQLVVRLCECVVHANPL